MLGAPLTHTANMHLTKASANGYPSAPLDISPLPTHKLYTKAHIQNCLLIIYTPVKDFSEIRRSRRDVEIDAFHAPKLTQASLKETMKALMGALTV